MLGAQSVEELFRFALLLSGEKSTALGLVAAALCQAEARAGQYREERYRLVWTARWLWDHWRRGSSARPYGGELEAGLTGVFKPLAARDRAALALRIMQHLELAEIAQILGGRPKELRRTLGNLYEARQAAGVDEARLRDEVVALRLGESERAQIASARKPVRVGRRRLESAVAGFAVVFSVLFLVGFYFWEDLRAGEGAAFEEQVTRLIELNENSSAAEFEPLEGRDPAALGDWFYLHGMEGVKVPSPIVRMPFSGGRVGQWRGADVAQLVCENPRAVLLVVRASALVPSTPRRGVKEGTLSASGWACRWQWEGSHLFVLGVRGGAQDLAAAFGALQP
ncbi:MAG: hypothetical protein RLZZ142_1895 [Verrucomicrobiota bacterium]